MTDTSVLLPIIRRVMPNIIANDIIGLSPWPGSNMSDIWTSSLQVVMTKVHYRHFLRVYNRRTHHLSAYITGLGYQTVRISAIDNQHLEAEQWCQANLKTGSYVRRLGKFWFAYNDDAVLFKMRWL